MSQTTAPGATDIAARPADLLRTLLRFDTTNPPGAEAACIAYIDQLLREAGLTTTLVARDPARPNLLARLPGRGNARPLLLYGHVDVVTTANQRWQYPPFEGVIADGYVWGRGALDMKGGIAMLLAAVLRAQAEGLAPAGDVLLCLVSDEEAGGTYGAQFLVEEHPHLFTDVRYAIGEFGGFSIRVGRQRVYPIMVAEKQVCWMRATVRGPGGHGSMPMHGGAMARAARLLRQLDRHRLPVHVTPVVRQFVETVAGVQPLPARLVLQQLLNPRLTDRVLTLLRERGRAFDPVLHNTVNATTIRGGEAINVIPSEIVVGLDGRLLPGFTPDDLQRELRPIIGPEVELEVTRSDRYTGTPDMGMFALLGQVLREADHEGLPAPMLLPGVTDGRFFARLGIQTYGFLPMPLPEELNFSTLIHAADERIPLAALEFGTRAISQVLQRF